MAITTNPTIAKLGSVFADPTLTAALLDRITHHCHIFGTGSESYRFHHSSGSGRTRINPPSHPQLVGGPEKSGR